VPLDFKDTLLDPRPAAVLYALAAVLAPAIVPYTLTVMRRVNDRLHTKADAFEAAPDVEKGADAGDEEVGELVGRWRKLNVGRAVLPGLSALAGVWAVVSRPEVVGFTVL